MISSGKTNCVQNSTLTFKCLHHLAPSYLRDFIVNKPSLGLGSDNQLELVMQRTHFVTYGDRAFSAAAANLWNSIPVAIRLFNSVATFKICIKTYLFNLAYPINRWFYQTEISCADRFYWSNVMVVVMCFYPNFFLCVLFICFWVLQKKRYINLTLHYITLSIMVVVSCMSATRDGAGINRSCQVQ